MADLTYDDKHYLKKLFEMDSGYVMKFSNRTFQEFIFDAVGKNIYDAKYENESGSKGKRLLKFWELEDNFTVGKLNKALVHRYKLENEGWYCSSEEDLVKNCDRISERLMQSSPLVSIVEEVLDRKIQDKDFAIITDEIKRCIREDKPEASLDRLHTFFIQYIRQLLTDHSITWTATDTLNALYGKYVNFLRANKWFETAMTEHIFKFSFQILEAYNDIRNNKSLAHPNGLLSKEESSLIANNVLNLINFIHHLEDKHKPKPVVVPDPYKDSLPF